MERELFEPIKKYFEGYGYTVDGEVKDIDIYMVKDDVGVAIELKEKFDFKLLQQAALRQKITDYVYIGIFKPSDLNTSSFKDRIYLLKRLGIGLIVVSKRTGDIEIISEPVVTELSTYQSRNKKNKKRLSNEFQKRKMKTNTGGVTGVKLMTSYREESLLVLDALLQIGNKASTKEIKQLSGIKNTTSILYNNYYHWFSRVDRGFYEASDIGIKASQNYQETIQKLKNKSEE